MAKKRKGERPDGLIQVALDVGYWPDGRRRRKYFYGHTREEANAKKAAFIGHRDSGSKFRQGITVSEWVEIFLATYRENVNPAYADNDAVPYRRLVTALGYRRMVDITEADLQRALNAVKGMSFSTVDKYRHAICRVFDRAKRNKIIADNPAAALVLPPYTKGTHRALESWEIALILEHWDEPRLYAGLWVMVMLLAGLRRGEMMALDWSAVDLENRVLVVQQVAVIHKNAAEIVQRAKSNAGFQRVIPICAALYDALSRTPPESRHGLVCLSAHGLQLTSKAVSRGLTTFCTGLERILNGEPAIMQGKRLSPAVAGRKRFSFRAHDLRHTYATMLYDSGVPVKAASYFLGHSDVKITLELYTHLSREREASSRQQMVKYLDRLLDSRVKFAVQEPHFQTDGGKLVVNPAALPAENGEIP